MTAYCEPADLSVYAIPQNAADSLSTDDKTAAIAAACAEMDGYFDARWTLPLTAWGEDVRRCAAVMAGADLLRVKLGYNADGSGSSFDTARAAAVTWLRAVSSGSITPTGIVDSSTDESAGANYAIVTRTRRGW